MWTEDEERKIRKAVFLKELMLEEPLAPWKLTKDDRIFLKGLGIKA